MDENDSVIWICQGPPFCHLEGDNAVAAQKAGCMMCSHIILHDDGTETEYNGGTA